MPGNRLVRDGLVTYDKGTYKLTDILTGLSAAQRSELEVILEQRITDYLEMRNPFGDSNLDAVPGNLRYEVLKRAKNRCELCGVSSRETQIDADHIIPRSKGGSNDIENLQALCRTCNAQKSNRDDTDFRDMADSYKHRQKGCVFCELPKKRIIQENELAIAFEDGYPVTEGHTLVIPKRHVADYFDLYQPERNAIQRLLESARERIMAQDSTVTGFNIGNNAGSSAGQTVYHCHTHLIPRRDGDCEDPRGGVRGVIAGKQKYNVSL
jgi:ATP adenylyltransferase